MVTEKKYKLTDEFITIDDKKLYRIEALIYFSNVKKDGKIVLRINGDTVISKKKRIMAPGEMETLIIPKRILDQYGTIESIEVGTED